MKGDLGFCVLLLLCISIGTWANGVDESVSRPSRICCVFRFLFADRLHFGWAYFLCREGLIRGKAILHLQERLKEDVIPDLFLTHLFSF